MLRLYYDRTANLENVHILPDMKKMIVSGNGWFDTYTKFDQEAALSTDFAKRLIKAVDNSDLVGPNLIISPVLGPIAPEWLSGGTKAILLLKFTDLVPELEAMGDNCFPFLKEICDEKDVTTCCALGRPLFEVGGFTEVYFINTDTIVHSDKELRREIRRSRGINW